MIRELKAKKPGKDTGLDSEELDQRLLSHHKALFTRILLPTVTVVTVFLVILYWRFDSKFYLGLGAVAVLDIFNVYFSLKNRRISTPWGTIESRSDAFDTLRWGINFILDAFIAWSFEVPTGPIFAAWIILTFGALTEVYNNRNKVITALVSLTCLMVLIGVLDPAPVEDGVFLIVCFISIIFIFWRLEVSLVREMQEYFKERIQRERVEAEAEKMQRDAAVGNSVRSLTHEINNLAAIASLTSRQIRQSEEDKPETLERLDRSLELMTKTSCLVLDDIGGHCATVRRYKLMQLAHETRLLLGGLIKNDAVRLYFSFPDPSDDVEFFERSGSTYLIIHNLAKNGLESIREKFAEQAGGRLEVAAEVSDEQIIISVIDNGAGMSAQQAQRIRDGNADTSKLDGHGLGMRFVRRECLENSYGLGVETSLGEGTRFSIQIPYCSGPVES